MLSHSRVPVKPGYSSTHVYSECWSSKGRGRQIPRTCWLGSLACLVSSRERTLSRKVCVRGGVAQWVKALGCQDGQPELDPLTHAVEGENKPPHIILHSLPIDVL